MNSGLKTGLAIALLLGGVFAVTVISQLSPGGRDKQKTPDNPDDSAPPLVYSVAEYHFDPHAEPDYYYNRLFDGFLEVGSGGPGANRRNWVGFVLRNVRSEPILLSPLKPSCIRCTSARAAVLPTAAVQEYACQAAISGFSANGGVPNPLAALGWCTATARLEWFDFDFSQPGNTFTVPAGSRDAPTWVLIELDFKVYVEAAPSPVTAHFELMDAKKNKLKTLDLKVSYASREPFEVVPKLIEAGQFPEGSEHRKFEVVAFSMTRDKFEPPDTLVAGHDPTVSLSPPSQMSVQECEKFSRQLEADLKGAVRVRSAYRYWVTVKRQAEGQIPEAGEFEKNIEFSKLELMPNRSYRVAVKGQIVGAVTIDGAAKLDVGTYENVGRVKKEFRLISEKTDLELELVPDRCTPKFVQLALGTPEIAFGRRAWTLTATIPERQGDRGNWNGTVVVRTKGDSPQVCIFKLTGYGR